MCPIALVCSSAASTTLSLFLSYITINQTNFGDKEKEFYNSGVGGIVAALGVSSIYFSVDYNYALLTTNIDFAIILMFGKWDWDLFIKRVFGTLSGFYVTLFIVGYIFLVGSVENNFILNNFKSTLDLIANLFPFC